jgi:hypothetical protein
VVAINLGDSKAKTTIDSGSAFKGYYYDYSTGKKFKVTSSRMTISVPASGFVIYSTALVK